MTLRTIDAASFFAPDSRPHGIPGDATPPSWIDLVTHARERSIAARWSDPLRAILIREHTRLGANSALLERIQSLPHGTVAIVAGQQAGLFVGPLYTCYKALHAIRLADRLTREEGIPAVPVFWIASDDHDLAEINHLSLASPDGSVSTVSYLPAACLPGTPAGEVILDDGIRTAVDTLIGRLPNSVAADRYRDTIATDWTPGVRWTDAFARQLLAMFGAQGLMLFDPRWAGMKALFAPLMARELADPTASPALVNDAADHLAAGHDRRHALRKADTATTLFLETNGIREALSFENDVFSTPSDRWNYTEIATILDAEPERFSPGAVLRPVCQDAILPVVATIAGPGERIYLSQLDGVYERLGVPRSLIWPRASFTAIDRRTLRNAAKEHIDPPRLFTTPDRLKAILARDQFPADLADRFDTIETSLNSGFERLATDFATLDPTLVPTARKELGRMLHQLNGLRERAVRSWQAGHDLGETRLLAASGFLLPGGTAQERWYGADILLSLLDEAGFADIAILTSPGEECHRIILPGGE